MTMEFCDKTFRGYHVLNCMNTNIMQKPKGPYHLLVLNDMFVENLLFHFKNHTFDVVHLHDSLLWPIAKYAAILFKCPIITSCHLSHALVHKDYPMFDQKTFEVTQEAHAYLMSHGITTCSQSYADDVEDYFMMKRNFNVIYNGVDLDRLKSFNYNPKLNQELGKGKPVVGFVGRMVPSKGIHLILEASKHCHDKQFVIISNVAPTIEHILPLVADVKKAVKEQDNVIWFRDLPTDSDQKWETMASCDMSIIPSIHEPWGIVTDEWGGLRVPKIVTKIDGLLEHNTEDNSIMINPDISSLIKALEQTLIPEKKENAYKIAENMTWKNTATQITNIYKEVINERNTNGIN